MSATITARLNREAHVFQAGESTGFGLSLGEQYYDHKTKQKEWTNYKAVIFARSQSQIDFYTSNLVKGSIVSVTCKQQKIDVYEGNNGQNITIEMVEASILNLFTGDAPQQAAPAPQQQAPQAPPPPAGTVSSYDDIPY